MSKQLIYEQRVRAYEAQGMTTSDAQGVVDAEDMKASKQRSGHTPENIEVGNLSHHKDRASAHWTLDGARFHVWFDIATLTVEGARSHGLNAKPTLYKNPIPPEDWDTRRLDASKPHHAEVIRQVFARVIERGLIGAAIAAAEEEERKLDAEAEEARNQERIKEAAPDLLAALEGLRKQLRGHVRMDVKKHYSLMVADVAADKAIRKARGQS